MIKQPSRSSFATSSSVVPLLFTPHHLLFFLDFHSINKRPPNQSIIRSMQLSILLFSMGPVAVAMKAGGYTVTAGKNAGTPPTAPWLMTANGAGTLATATPHLALSHQPEHLAYPQGGGAALHDTSYVYTKTTAEPPTPMVSPGYSAPNIGLPVPSMSLLETTLKKVQDMPPLVSPGHGGSGYQAYNPAIHHPMFSHPNMLSSSPLTNLPVSVYPGSVVQHSPVVLPTSPGNGFASFSLQHPMHQTSTTSATVAGVQNPTGTLTPTSLYPVSGIQTPYQINSGGGSAGGVGHFQYPAAFLQERDLPASAKWIQPPDPKHRFGAGVPMAPSTEIHPAVATTPFPGIGANQGTAQVYGSNDATKYEDPHPPPGSPPAWHHQSSVENPQYQQTNTFVKPADPETEIPQFTMPQRLRLRRRR